MSEYEEAYGVMSSRLQSQVQMVLATEIKLQSNIADINGRLVKVRWNAVILTIYHPGFYHSVSRNPSLNCLHRRRSLTVLGYAGPR